MNTAAAEVTHPATAAGGLVALPAIGAAFLDGIFAGITLHEDKPHALILLPEDGDNMEWPDALEFAAKQDGVLPSRIDMIVLHKNVRDQFNKRDWYWTSEENPSYAGYAFIQPFANGAQNAGHKGGAYRARAVRRVAL